MIGGGRISGVGGLLGNFRQGAVLIMVLLLPAVSGCPLLWFALSPGDCGLYLTIQGQLLDADTATPLSGVIVAGSTFFENGQSDYVPLTQDGEAYSPLSMDDGTFSISPRTLGPCPPGPYPTPDRIEIVVRRDTCESTYTIDVNDATVVDLGTTDDGGSSTHTLELKDPILVPACDGGTQP